MKRAKKKNSLGKPGQPLTREQQRRTAIAKAIKYFQQRIKETENEKEKKLWRRRLISAKRKLDN